jgi:HEAT repeat protein
VPRESANKEREMLTAQRILIRVTLLAATVAIAVFPAQAADNREKQLIAVLRSDAASAEKAITCKRLAIYGTKDAVPPLATLLPDSQLSSWARIALEAIPGPEADAALREAMTKVKGRLLVGVINSIGVRRDPAAVATLAARIDDPDSDVASAAAVALGKIGGEAATESLQRSLTAASAPVRSAVAEGCILCAERALAEGKATEAARLYDLVRTGDVPKQRIVEATRGAILARGSAGIPLLLEQLRSGDKAMFAIGLSTARELAGDGVSEALVDELVRSTPERQRLLLLALADRGDATVLPAALRAAAGGPKPSRIAAMGLVRRLGDESCVPALLEAAGEGDAELTQAATAALEGLHGPKVDADLVARLAAGEGRSREALIDIVGRRRIAAAVAGLKEASEDPDAPIRSAALIALGSTIGPGDIEFLIERVVRPRHTEDADAARRALRAACVRMPDSDACAAKLVAGMAESPAATRCALLETLGAMGGDVALEAVGKAAKDSDPQIRETASRLLGKWMTADAAPVLLELAKTAPEAKHQVRALRGYIRLARQFPMPDGERAAMCRKALVVAKRPEEKKLVLAVMERYPSVEMLGAVVEAMDGPALKNDSALKKDAERVSMAIGEKILAGQPTELEWRLLDEISRGPVKIEIVKAEYGAGTKFVDVTETLKKYSGSYSIIVLPSPRYNVSFGGDPAPNVVKRLRVQYRINGKPGEATFEENALITLPMPK